MYMSYTTNPHLPRVRMQAVELVRSGWSARRVARHLGFAHNTVLNWLDRKPEYGLHGALVIPTRSSRPHHNPRELSPKIVSRILELRQERNQCAELLHHRLAQEGVRVGLSSVKRTLRRRGVTRFSQWKKWHQYPERPLPEKPGILVQIDTILDGPPRDRLYIYTMLDVCSRWSYALPVVKINTLGSWRFVTEARKALPFTIATLQSDHGAEFSKWFTKQCAACGFSHRHSRVRRPTDNGHLERFNRTIQEECLGRITKTFSSYQRAIPEYLHYYNTERPHMGLNYQTPLEVVKWSEAID